MSFLLNDVNILSYYKKNNKEMKSMSFCEMPGNFIKSMIY